MTEMRNILLSYATIAYMQYLCLAANKDKISANQNIDSHYNKHKPILDLISPLDADNLEIIYFALRQDTVKIKCKTPFYGLIMH